MQPKKSLGQNFLHDETIISQIVASLNPQKNETLLEIGPGEGVLTDYLVRSGAKTLAIELDDRLVLTLENRFQGKENFFLHHGNILRTHVAKELSDRKLDTHNFRVVGNLPYYITSAIIRMFLEMETKPQEMFFMVQREVAERITAKPGDMSILAVSVQYYAQAEILFDVPATAFDPIPKVESAFLKIRPHIKNFPPHKEEVTATDGGVNDKNFFRIVRAGFCARRKTLINNLANSLHIPRETLEKTLNNLDIPLTARAQELSIEQWKSLTKFL